MAYIYIKKAEVKRIYQSLKAKGFSVRQISEYIGSQFTHQLYDEQGLALGSFEKLKELFEEAIQYSIKSRYRNCNMQAARASQNKICSTFFLEESPELAELVGILLGDGCLYKNDKTHQCKVMVSLNKDDIEYVNYVKELIKKTLNRECKLYIRESMKVIELVIYSKETLDGLISIGLESGRKINNQSGVPRWIMENREFTIACLRGLVDTDGCIFLNRRDDVLGINFSNHSERLLYDFKEMCESLDINITKIQKDSINIYSKSTVKQFLTTIQPIKWKVMLSKVPSIKYKLEYKR